MYDAGATVTIDIAGRAPALGECLISWDAIPQNVTFQFDEATAAGGVAPVVADRGLLYGYVADTVEQAWWTGGAGDGNIADPGNWLCKNANGDTVTGEAAVPSAATHIYLEGSLNINVPTSSALICRLCTLTNATLAGDCDLRGFGTALEVAPNAVIDLNGHKLYARSAAFTGVCTVKGADIGHADDLTTTDASRVFSPTTFHVSGMKATNLFNNNYSRNTSGTTGRIIVNQGGMPLEATYDFGEGQEKVVDAYRIWTGKIEGYTQRLPRVWKFEGSNDNENWTLLDKRGSDAAWQAANMHRTYTFPNTTAYRYYRITITENNGPDTDGRIFLELVQLEYFHLKQTQGELHLETAAGETVAPANMTLSGNLRFFIEGAGTLNLSKTGQTYIGGTEICGGTVSGGPTGDLLYKDIFGEEGSEVIVHGDGTTTISATNAVLGFLNRTGYTGYKYVLGGGLLNNADDGIVTELRLTADSYMQVTKNQSSNYAWIGRSGSAAYVDLGGHELSMEAATGKRFGLMNATLENGSVYMRSGGWFSITNSVVATNNVTLTVGCASDIAGSVAVADYIVLQCNKNYNSGAGVIDVYGTFGMNSRIYHGTRLHDGSTIDFTRYGADIPFPLPTVAMFAASATGEKTLYFESGATIGVKLGTRRVASGSCVISWTAETAPDDSVKFVCADADKRYKLVKKSDGLYLYRGFSVIVR